MGGRAGAGRRDPGLEHLGLLAVVGAAVLVRAYYLRLWVDPFGGPGGILEGSVDAVVDGEADAPFQYRPSVPWLLDLLRDHGATIHDATVLVDSVMIAVGCVAGLLLFRRAGIGEHLAVGAAAFALLGLGVAFYPKPETFASFAVVTLAGHLLLAGCRSAPHLALVVAAGAALAGLRADLVVALAAGFACRWALERHRLDLVAAATLVVLAVGAMVLVTRLWPDAAYDPGTGVVQLRYNADLDVLAIAAAVVALPVAPLLRRDRRAIVGSIGGRAGLPLVLPLLVQVGFTAVVGRLDEIRIFLPFAFVAAAGATLLWREAVAADRGSGD